MQMKIAIVLVAFSFVPFKAFGAMDVATPKTLGAPGAKGSDSPKMVPLESLTANSPFAKEVKEHLENCAQEVMGDDAKDCTVEDLGQVGDEAHQSRISCHNLKPPQAWDIGVVKCGGVTLDPKKDKDKYLKLTECVVHGKTEQSTMQKIGSAIQSAANYVLDALFSKPGADVRVAPNHDNHMHVEIKGCMVEAAKLGNGMRTAMSDRIEDGLKWFFSQFSPVNETIAELPKKTDLPQDFVKNIDATGVGKLRVEYKDYGDPVSAPANLNVFLKCDGSKKEILVSHLGMCMVRSYQYVKEDKTLKLAVMKERVNHSAAFCDVAEEEEFDIGQACKDFWRNKLSRAD